MIVTMVPDVLRFGVAEGSQTYNPGGTGGIPGSNVSPSSSYMDPLAATSYQKLPSPQYDYDSPNSKFQRTDF